MGFTLTRVIDSLCQCKASVNNNSECCVYRIIYKVGTKPRHVQYMSNDLAMEDIIL